MRRCLQQAVQTWIIKMYMGQGGKTVLSYKKDGRGSEMKIYSIGPMSILWTQKVESSC